MTLKGLGLVHPLCSCQECFYKNPGRIIELITFLHVVTTQVHLIWPWELL